MVGVLALFQGSNTRQENVWIELLLRRGVARYFPGVRLRFHLSAALEKLGFWRLM